LGENISSAVFETGCHRRINDRFKHRPCFVIKGLPDIDKPHDKRL